MLAVLALAATLALAACSSADDPAPDRLGSEEVGGRVVADSTISAVSDSPFLGDYELEGDGGARPSPVTVTVADGMRTIETEQLIVVYPSSPRFTGSSTDIRRPGVSIDGLPFEPGATEVVVCESGPSYTVAAPTPGGPVALALALDGFGRNEGEPDGAPDLVHVGFAADGHLLYVSRSGRFRPSFRLADGPRRGTGCGSGDEVIELEGTDPDGSYASDWVFDRGIGDLDRCNGTTIEGEYLYLLTDAYPFAPRCLNGVLPEASLDEPPEPDGAGGGAGSGGAGGGAGASGG